MSIKKSTEMNTLFFGGSFNPIHNGHLIMARCAAEQLGIRHVILIPCSDPPHKSDLLPFEQRVDIIGHTTLCDPKYNFDAGGPWVSVSTVEKRLRGKSYTYLTVQQLFKEYEGKISWLIGGDTVAQLPTWYRIEELLELDRFEFIVTERPGYVIPWETLPDYVRRLKKSVVSVPLLNISSTELRQRIKVGKSLRYFMPDSAARFIYDMGFYYDMGAENRRT